MKYCSECGDKVELRVPEGDNRERHICIRCDVVHYQNPKTVVGTVPLYHNSQGEPSILLCKRGIEPRLGYWTLPAGFLENDETTLQGAVRETLEETCAEVSHISMYRVLNVPYSNQIHIFFRASLPEPVFSVTSESTEVRLFGLDEIPWRQLSFPTVYKTLKDFVLEYKTGEFTTSMHDIDRSIWDLLDH